MITLSASRVSRQEVRHGVQGGKTYGPFNKLTFLGSKDGGLEKQSCSELGTARLHTALSLARATLDKQMGNLATLVRSSSF